MGNNPSTAGVPGHWTRARTTLETLEWYGLSLLQSDSPLRLAQRWIPTAYKVESLRLFILISFFFALEAATLYAMPIRSRSCGHFT